MKILLINQSNGIHINHNPPLGILYLAATLKRTGHDVIIYDQGAQENGLQYPSFEKIRELRPDIVGFSLYTFGLTNTFHYIRMLKNAFPEITIILGGHHATALPERTLIDCPEADFLIFGEGEITTIELLNAIQKNTDVSVIAGIYFRKNGAIMSTPPRPYIKDLDEIPFPANELIQGYTYPSENISKGKKILNMLASRGCPFNCAYCNKAVYGSSYRRRSPKNVADEIEYMFDKFGYDEVMFHDELFTANKQWMRELFGEITKRGLRFPWRCLGRVGTVTYKDLLLMKDNGCYIIAFGLESGNENVRTDIGRKMTGDAIRTTFSDARKAGLLTYAFNMINHRLDTIDTIKDTYNLMCQVNAAFSPVFVCSPLPGSTLYQLLPEDIKYDWERFNSYREFGTYPISISFIPEKDLMMIADQMESFYYSRFRYAYENILKKGIPPQVRKMILKLWLGYIICGRLKYTAKGDSLFMEDKTLKGFKKVAAKILFSLSLGLVSLFKEKPMFQTLYKKMK